MRDMDRSKYRITSPEARSVFLTGTKYQYQSSVKFSNWYPRVHPDLLLSSIINGIILLLLVPQNHARGYRCSDHPTYRIHRLPLHTNFSVVIQNLDFFISFLTLSYILGHIRPNSPSSNNSQILSKPHSVSPRAPHFFV